MTFLRFGFGVLIACLLLVTNGLSAQRGDSAQALLRAAIDKEVVDGDLKGAIAAYQAIVDRFAKTDRASAAQTLLRLAQAYEALRDPRATDAYQRIVSEFGDQPASVEARSRVRLSETRTVWAGVRGGIFGGGLVSRDGRWMPYVDFDDGGNLSVHDFSTGQDIQLTDTASVADVKNQRYAGQSRFSRDGKQIAFAWFNGTRYEIRIVEFNPLEKRRPRTLYVNPDIAYIQPFDWSPNGQVLAVQAQRGDRAGQIALLSVSTGTLTPLKTFDWRDESSQMLFSPDGSRLAYDLPTNDDPGERDVFAIRIDGQHEEITVANHRRNDQMVAWSPDGSHIIFSSDRSSTVELWTQRISSGQASGQPTVLPSTFSGFSRGVTASGALYDLKTTYGESAFRMAGFDFASGRATGAPVDPGEEYFSINLRSEPTWSVDGRSIALMRRDRGGPVGMLVSIVGNDGQRILDVRPRMNAVGQGILWDGTSIVAVGQDLKDRPGVYRIATDTGRATPLFDLPNADGFYEGLSLVGLSRDGADLFYRRAAAGVVRLVARNVTAGTEREIIQVSQPGLLQPKLSPNGALIVALQPEDGGALTLVVVDVASGARRTLSPNLRVARPPSVLIWNPDSRSIFLRPAPEPGQTARTLRVAIDTGIATPVEWGLPEGRMFMPDPNGRRIVFVVDTSERRSEIRVSPNLLGSIQTK